MCVSGDCESCTRANEYERANDELTGRVEELEAALRSVLPMAKGYAYAHPVGANQAKCDAAEDVLED